MVVLLISVMIGGILFFFVVFNLGNRFDKKVIVFWSGLLVGLVFILLFYLRMLGFFFENGMSLLLFIYVVILIVVYIVLMIVISLINFMMVDVVDEFEL